MSIPKYDALFNPLLEALHELGGSASVKKVVNKVAKLLKLTEREVNEIHKGNRTKLEYRLAWTSNYLKRYGLIDKSKRGTWSLTSRGKDTKVVDLIEVNKTVKALDKKSSTKASNKRSDHSGPVQKSKVSKKSYDAVDMALLLKDVNWDRLEHDPHFLNNPGVRVRDILTNVEKKWVLPDFQRYYDWSKEDVRAFLESIFKDYFVGSLLLWEIEKEPAIDLFPIEGVKGRMEIDKPEVIILDGQQRVTSLYYAIKCPEIKDDKVKSYFYINFRNLIENPFADIVIADSYKFGLKESVEALLFPLYELENHINWIRVFEDYYESQEGVDRRKLKDLSRVIQDRVTHFLQNFHIPEIRLPSTMKLHHVVDIFEKINTTGKSLDTFDILIAASSKHGIELRKLWENSCQKYPKLAQYAEKTKDKIRMYILQSIALVYNSTSSIKRADILNLHQQIYSGTNVKKEFGKHWEEMTERFDYSIREIENLRDGFGVLDCDYIPFMPAVPLLAALNREIDKRQDKPLCKQKIKQWYWSAIFGESYSSSADTQSMLDFKELRIWFDNDKKVPKSVEKARNSVANLNLKEINSGSIYKGILSLYAIRGSKDLQTGEMVSDRNKYHKDHIFPKSKASKYVSDSKLIDSILNMAWLTDSTNQRKADREPDKYFEEFANQYNGDKKSYLKVLDSHYISKSAHASLLENNFDDFINERERILMSEIKELVGWKESSSLFDIPDSFSKLVSSFEGEKLEFKSTFKKNLETLLADDVIKFSVLKTIAGFLNAKGGALIIGYNERDKKLVGLAQDYLLMRSPGRDGFELEFWSYIKSKIKNKDVIERCVNLEFREIDGHEIAVIKVERSPEAVFILKNGKKMLYVRNKNETESFEDAEEIHNYLEKHF